jgi:hypothetical protein
MKTLVCLIAFAALCMAADLTGKWTGSFNMSGPNGEGHDSEIVLNLKQSGGDLTGTAGPNEGEQWPITNGKVEGNKVTFDVKHEENLIKFELAMEADHIKGGATMAMNGETRTAKVDAGRAK